MGMVAALLGKPLMAWQQHVADVILEIDPDTGDLAYDEYDVLTPRQSGKSTFILAKATHRSSATKFFGPRQRLVYTAQNRLKAREKWEEDFCADLLTSPKLKSRVSISKAGGSEHIRYANGSRFGIESNTEKAGHGSTLDEAFIDEAFAQVDNRLEQAFEPAMITRRNKQLGVISTAGWSDVSSYLWDKVKVGRRLVRDGVRKGVAYFEWSAPDDADPGAVETWLACMPALHRPECAPRCKAHTVTIAAIQAVWDKAKRSGKIADFCRAYLNQWKKKPREVEETALGDWSSCLVDFYDGLGDFPQPLAVGVAADRDRTCASIGTAGVITDALDPALNGRVLVVPTDRRDGVEWLGPELLRIQQEHDVAVVIDEKGPIGDLIPSFEELGIKVTPAKLNDCIAAHAAMHDNVPSPINTPAHPIAHLGSPDLDDAVLGARWRDVGDRKVFGRKQSISDISMLEAVALAAWATSLAGAYDVLDSVF